MIIKIRASGYILILSVLAAKTSIDSSGLRTYVVVRLGCAGFASAHTTIASPCALEVFALKNLAALSKAQPRP